MRLSVYNLALLLFLSPSSALVLLKREYAIGIWSNGDPDVVLMRWKPIFETYLTETVGRSYDPPISFRLVTVDFSEDQTTEDLITSGAIDFLCKCLDRSA
jgi:hypothetical protein